MAERIGIVKEIPEVKDRYVLHGFEPGMTYDGRRWIRVGCLYPETVDFVEFHRNGDFLEKEARA